MSEEICSVRTLCRTTHNSTSCLNSKKLIGGACAEPYGMLLGLRVEKKKSLNVEYYNNRVVNGRNICMNEQ